MRNQPALALVKRLDRQKTGSKQKVTSRIRKNDDSHDDFHAAHGFLAM